MHDALRDVTEEEIEAYNRDGFVKLGGVLPEDWVTRLRATIQSLYERGILHSKEMEVQAERALEQGGRLLVDGAEGPTGKFCVSTAQWNKDGNLGELCLKSPLPQLAAQLFGSPKINFLIDQIFLKEPGAAQRTAFHSDESYFNCTGEQCATFWIPVDIVDKANGAMGYVPGSHLWRRKFQPNAFVTQEPIPGFDGERIPDIEGNEEKFGVRYIESRPGDIIVHHYRTLHGSTGNVDPTRIRRAAAFRYGGEDLRYLERVTFTSMVSSVLQNGDPMDSPEFPVVYENGRAVALL